MPWLTTATSANRINISKREDVEPASYTVWGVITAYERSTTIEVYKYVGMTEAGADAALALINDPPNNVVAVKQREGPSGNYMLTVTETTRGAWGPV
tara:strand:+ start:4820 stop:5110 length:291 start_codon:yes stop_codon:yes gene_type:complete